jgi:uncharacterized protein (DUF433 family)
MPRRSKRTVTVAVAEGKPKIKWTGYVPQDLAEAVKSDIPGARTDQQTGQTEGKRGDVSNVTVAALALERVIAREYPELLSAAIRYAQQVDPTTARQRLTDDLERVVMLRRLTRRLESLTPNQQDQLITQIELSGRPGNGKRKPRG